MPRKVQGLLRKYPRGFNLVLRGCQECFKEVFFLYFMEVSRFLRVFQYCTDFQKKIFKGDLEQNPLDFSSEKYPIIQQNLFGYMSKLGLPYLPSRLIWTKISLDKYSYCRTYPKSLEIFALKFVLKHIFTYLC